MKIKKHIDISTNVYSLGLYTRKIWEILLNEYYSQVKKEKLNLDNLFCDFQNIEKRFTDKQGMHVNKFVCYWGISKNGLTELGDDPASVACSDYYYKIEYNFAARSIDLFEFTRKELKEILWKN
jgi:hypothetical protein